MIYCPLSKGCGWLRFSEKEHSQASPSKPVWYKAKLSKALELVLAYSWQAGREEQLKVCLYEDLNDYEGGSLCQVKREPSPRLPPSSPPPSSASSPSAPCLVYR